MDANLPKDLLKLKFVQMKMGWKRRNEEKINKENPRKENVYLLHKEDFISFLI